MSRLQTYQIFPAIPEKLMFLEILSRNIWWSWNHGAKELFRRIDTRLWEEAERNPIVFLTYISQKRFKELENDNSFLSHQQRVKERFEKEISCEVDRSSSVYGPDGVIAYFSMEFGLHESLPLFAGGLGILAGDHLKAASSLKIPLVGVGLLYRQGYFQQFLNHEGWQQEEYPENSMYHLPVEKALDISGKFVRVRVSGPDGDIQADVWKLMAGRIPLYLLDTNLPENPSKIRHVTARLYDGDPKTRLAQEVLLGIGGLRALAAMGIDPTVCHMNEGHSAFCSIERIAQTMSRRGMELKYAKEYVPRTTAFTTHTPVAAGHDEFPVDMVRPYIKSFQQVLGIRDSEILSWGQPVGSEPSRPVSMFVLGLRMSQYCNGVSRLHGTTARKMWAHVWPRWPEDEIPIVHITNGVHVPTWISHENDLLFERYLGPEWTTNFFLPEIAGRIDEIYDEELWRAHEICRSRLIRNCRKLMSKQYGRRNAPKKVMKEVEGILDQDVLTIAFARRFATYKRAELLLQDTGRLEAMINHKDKPVQLIFAGKAHPKDREGKELIRRIFQFAKSADVRHRVTFLENYDTYIARLLVQGADVWLNLPRRPLEACGTSGIKAALNGVLNVSVLDGWWCEGFSEDRGWKVGNGEVYPDAQYQDAVESQALFNVLENDVIPCFYERDVGDLPLRWLYMMKESMKMVLKQFSSHRMVSDYENQCYIPSVRRSYELLEHGSAELKSLTLQHERLMSLWNAIRVDLQVRGEEGPFRVGEDFPVSADIYLGKLMPNEVDVELYHGVVRSVEKISDGEIIKMDVSEDLGNGRYRYGCTVTCEKAGRYGFTVRVKARGDKWITTEPTFLTWA
ncbi:MAG: alpha-glucan family phosphorylase [Desulfobacterales bacterium]|nr:alpha-glucan family phosphorylase [Desulfobacterales bacterium]